MPTRNTLAGTLAMGAALLTAILLVSPVATAAPSGQADCPGNLLVNGNFEGGSRKTESLGTSLSSAVADGWFPWFVRGDEANNREPEFKVEQVAIGGDPYRIRSGGQSQKFFTTWATHTAGIYQRVSVPRNATLQFAVYGMAYSGEADIFDPGRRSFLSDPQKPGNYRLWAGIDPTGAVPSAMGAPPPASVIWSEPSMVTDEWVMLTVVARAQGAVVTVYTKGTQDWSVKHNDSFWEDACLVVAGRGSAAALAAAAAAAPEASAGESSGGQAQAEQPAGRTAAVSGSPPRQAAARLRLGVARFPDRLPAAR